MELDDHVKNLSQWGRRRGLSHETTNPIPALIRGTAGREQLLKLSKSNHPCRSHFDQQGQVLDSDRRHVIFHALLSERAVASARPFKVGGNHESVLCLVVVAMPGKRADSDGVPV